MNFNIKEIKNTLVDLKFIDGDISLASLDEASFSRILTRLNARGTFNTSGLKPSQEDFYTLGLNLLGYENIGGDVLDLARSKGLYVEEGTYTNEVLLKNLYSLLTARTKTKEEFFPKLCIWGAFNDYNLNRPEPKILYFNGKTQPIFDYNEAIFEKVYIETPLDTDQDGKRDLILTYIRRPLETERGMKVPIIYIASPYMMGGDDDDYILHEVDKDLELIEETKFTYEDIAFKGRDLTLPSPRTSKGLTKAEPSDEIAFDSITPWYNYFLTRGYAIVFAGGIGTRGSEGIRTCGSIEETISTISVVDWLNNRLPAFSNKEDNLEVRAHWSTGNVGMMGKSYLGTLAIAAATTGVPGLKTIVPEAAISNWYDYYRSNGLVSSALDWQGDDADLLAKYCFSRVFDKEDYARVKDVFLKKHRELIKQEDRTSGNYNTFWDERNYLNGAKNIKSSVLIVHGLKDWNVKPKQCHMLWEAMEGLGIERKMILHQGDHIYINDHSNFDFTDIMNRWFDHYLYGFENDVYESFPNVIVQNNTDINSWEGSSSWPFEAVNYESFYPNSQGRLSRKKENIKNIKSFEDNLSKTGFNPEKPNEAQWLDNIVLNTDEDKPYRLAYVTSPLKEDILISGVVKFKCRLAANSKTGILSAMLVDYGEENRPSLELEVIKEKGLNMGINAGFMDLKTFKLEANPSKYAVITRDSMNIQNREGLINKKNVVENKFYDYEFNLEPMQYTVLKGHKLGLIIYSTDAQLTQRPVKITNFEIDEASIEVQIPILVK